MNARYRTIFQLLLLTAALWALAFWVSQRESPLNMPPQASVTRLQVRVQTTLRLAAAAADDVLAQLPTVRTPFSQLVTPPTDAALFAFRHDSLVWWSDHALLSDFDNVTGSFRYRAVETKRGKQLVTLRSRGGFHVLAYVPLESRYAINNRYLQPAMSPTLFEGGESTIVIDEKALLPQVRAADHSYLFSVAPVTDAPTTRSRPNASLALVLLVGGTLAFVAASGTWAGELNRQGRRGAAAWALLLPLTALRLALLFTNLPFALVDWALFDPKYYAASWLAPSLGDQLLNIGLLTIVAAYGLVWLRDARPGPWLRERLPYAGRLAGALLAVALVFGVLWLRYRLYADTFSNSQLDLDVVRNTHFTWLHVMLLGLLVGQSTVLGVGLYLIVRIGTHLLPQALQGRSWKLLLAAEMILWAAAFGLGSHTLALAALALVFAKAVLLVSIRARARRVPYPVTVFLFGAMVLWALVGALAQQRHFAVQRRLQEQKVAASLLLEHDVLGEFLLEEVAAQIGADPLVERTLQGSFAQPEIARQKIEKYYLRDYFAQYETAVRFFDGNGREFGASRLDTTRGLDQYRRRVLRGARPTEHPGLYLVSEARDLAARRYVKLVRLRDVAGAATPPPTVVIELRLKKLNPYSVVPELLVDQKYAANNSVSDLDISYGVFGRQGLIAAEGDYDFADWRAADPRLRDEALYGEGITDDGHHFWALRFGQPGRVLVLTTPAYRVVDVLANFSFLFLPHLLGGLLGIGLVALLRKRQTTPTARASLSTKVQGLLNAGSLVPLLVVSVAAVSVSTRAYERDLIQTYQQRGERVQQTLQRLGVLEQVGRSSGFSREELTRLTDDVAALAGTDVLLYDPRGALLTSSQSLLFETGALSKLLNPVAIAALRDRGQSRILLPERAGTLTFNALYLPLLAGPEAGPGRHVAGFIGLPFFDSAQALDAKLRDLITTMLNVFTVMFILVTLVTFLGARRLTAPLRVLAERLNQTTLTGQNERLAYESSDEIGLLVGEYNQMLTKLEASRQELATRTQEAAWREMARQVAHEIKNPLTPMKLSLQYLQRALHDGRTDIERLVEKVSDTLITQVDTLADIASSFSSFVSLPEPKPESLEVLDLLRHCLDLHTATQQTPVATELPEAWVRADKNLVVRVFNNLILNAIQAVPSDREPHVRASVEREGADLVRIGIHDNGSGIPADIQPRVFVPNFSTKFTGSGIGLAVVKRAIENMGGRVWFDTREGEGTTFYLTLPLVT